MWDKTLRILGVATLVFIIGNFFLFFSNKEEVDVNEFDRLFRENYSVYALSLPEQHDFAGEEVPLEDPEVYERLDREMLVNTYWQSNGLLLLKRSNRYFPTIERILKEEGIPDDFKYLALIESGLTHVVSPAGAASFWQIMETTGRELGLEINSEIDERYHVEKSTRAACAYLKQAYERFGSWTLAAASYNMGMGGLSRQLERQEAESYYDLLLNSETRRYVFRILALKKILEDPSAFGFKYRKSDLYSPFKTKSVKIDNSILDLVAFAHQNGMTYKTLKYYNPWLRDEHLNIRFGQMYYIEIPDSASTTPLKIENDSTSSKPSDSTSVD
jgi:hypothetical protein